SCGGSSHAIGLVRCSKLMTQNSRLSGSARWPRVAAPKGPLVRGAVAERAYFVTPNKTNSGDWSRQLWGRSRCSTRIDAADVSSDHDWQKSRSCKSTK